MWRRRTWWSRLSMVTSISRKSRWNWRLSLPRFAFVVLFSLFSLIQFDEDDALRPTIINVRKVWNKKSTKVLCPILPEGADFFRACSVMKSQVLLKKSSSKKKKHMHTIFLMPWLSILSSILFLLSSHFAQICLDLVFCQLRSVSCTWWSPRLTPLIELSWIQSFKRTSTQSVHFLLFSHIYFFLSPAVISTKLSLIPSEKLECSTLIVNSSIHRTAPEELLDSHHVERVTEMHSKLLQSA